MPDGRVHAQFQTLYVNCWHMNEHERPAMWKLCTSMSDSICIRSTYERLWQCLPEKGYHLGKVTYLDYELGWFDPGKHAQP